MFDLAGFIAGRGARRLERFEDLGLCTYAEPERFFSYRRTRIRGARLRQAYECDCASIARQAADAAPSVDHSFFAVTFRARKGIEAKHKAGRGC